jgi:hypothetical protein
MGCGEPVTPAAVLAPYERGTEVTRGAKSQRERDDDAKRTVLLAGEFLRRVAALLDDPKMHPASADLLDWYREEITDARKERDAGRLAELGDEFKADRENGAFRRAHWWQGSPAALDGGDAEPEDDEEEYDDDGQDDGPQAALAVPAAIAAKPTRATWADALAARRWRIAVAGNGGVRNCQIADERGQQCREPVGGSPPVNDGITDGHVCAGHYNALGAAISAINRNRGIM